ncbi:uncharacterized protein LOC128962942 isoform X2 [Oppia nitens]|nr:uncharacterized protein LOC128962942 isoform X2 [Oppia nitens]
MCDNYVKDFGNYCRNNGIPEEAIKYTTDSNTNGMGKYWSIVFVDMDGLSDVIRGSAFGDTELDSCNNAAKQALDKCGDRVIVELLDKIEHMVVTKATDAEAAVGSGDQQDKSGSSPVSTGVGDNNVSRSTDATTRSPTATGDITNIPNPIGYLNELSANKKLSKTYTFPDYKVIKRSGADHNLEFTFECKMFVNGIEMVVRGKGSNKKRAKEESAKAMIRLINSQDAGSENISPNTFSGGQQQLQQQVNRAQDLNTHIRNISQNSAQKQQLNDWFVDETLDYQKKLDKILPLLGCYAKYDQSWDGQSCSTIVEVIVTHLTDRWFKTIAMSDKGANDSQLKAARKTIIQLKINVTDDDDSYQ